MTKQSQNIIIEKRLNKYGQVNNLWAINNYILRLGAVIHRLKDKGLDIKGNYLLDKNKIKTKIYNYKLIK